MIRVTASRKTHNQLKCLIISNYAIIFTKVSIKENLQNIRERIISLGRDPQEIKLIAVTKTIPVALIEQAILAGVTDLGENKVQEAIPKIDALKQKYPHVTWHMLGHLQRNKVKQALGRFDLIQSVDSERLAQEIQDKAKGQIVPVLLEINTSGEESKFGVQPESAQRVLQTIAKFSNIKVQGLMTIGLFSDDLEKVRPCFKKLKTLSEKIKELNLPNVEMKYLSMGMSDDFETAIQEGSNVIRIGRAIFGKRS